MHDSGKPAEQLSSQWTRRKRHAPMFSGSSCTQTTGVPSAIRRQARRAARCIGQRIELLERMIGDVVAAELARALRAARSRSCREHSRTRVDVLRRRLAESAITRWKRPAAKLVERRDCTRDAAAGSWASSRPAACATAAAPAAAGSGSTAPASSGRRPGCCLRRPSARNRSRRALECSGPCPSKPCGSSSTRPLSRRHLSSALAMNWSMITCAALTKSPNCASHSDEPVGAVEAVAVLEAQHAGFGERAVDRSRPAPGRATGAASGM